MRRFEDLTGEGKARRLRAAAVAALESYDVEVASLRRVAVETNITFRVDCADGSRRALRVECLERDTVVDIPTETTWLSAMGEAGLPVVKVSPTSRGDLYATVEVPGVPEPRRCVLFEWLPGRLVDESPDQAFAGLGEAAARIHDHGSVWEPPPGMRPLRWDGVFYYPDEEVVLFDAGHSDLMPSGRTAVFRRVIDRIERDIARLWSEGTPGYTHGDLSAWNAMVHRGRVTAFDFEYVTVGFPVQDIATTLYYGRDQANYRARCRAFRRGYERVRSWPVEYCGQLELHMAARSVMFANYVMRAGGAGGFAPDEFLHRVEPRLVQYLDEFADSGRLRERPGQEPR